MAQVRDQSKTGEGSPDDDDSYLGYSVTTGEFDGDPTRVDTAVGMPRGADLQVRSGGGVCCTCPCSHSFFLSFLQGKVLIYDSRLTNLHNLTGDQVGAYFGYSLAAGDLDGDGRDDLAVGAPMWTDYSEKQADRFETGKVFIVYQDADVSED